MASKLQALNIRNKLLALKKEFDIINSQLRRKRIAKAKKEALMRRLTDLSIEIEDLDFDRLIMERQMKSRKTSKKRKSSERRKSSGRRKSSRKIHTGPRGGKYKFVKGKKVYCGC